MSDLKRPPKRLQSQAIIGLSLLNTILMACFLKQSFAETCLRETDNGTLQQFNYSGSLITNRGTVERGKIHSAPAMKQNDRHFDRLTDSVNMISNVQTTPWHWHSVQGLLK